MGKKQCRSAYTSRSERPNVSSATVKLVRKGTDEATKLLNKVAAWKKGKNPWISVPGFSRLPANVLWGDPKRRRRSAEGDDTDIEI